MAGEYLPLELVHAHLPAAPAPPSSIRLVNISDIPKPPSKDVPLHREHASSAAFDAVHNVQARVIDNGYILELRQINLHRSQSDEPLRIAFHRPLLDLPADCFASTSTHLCLYVATARSLYRLRFSARPHVKFNTDQGWAEVYESSEENAITPWLAVEEDLAVMTAADGSLVTIAYEGAQEWATQQHRPAVSRLRLPSFIAGKSNDEQAVSLARHQNLVYTLSRNGRLRVWRLDRCENVRILDMEAPIEAGAQHIRIVPHPSPTRYSHLVVVYKPGAFVVYRATESGELIVAGEREAKPGVLCGFDIIRDHGYRIHALFDRGIVQHESVLMDDIFQFTTQVSSAPPEWIPTVGGGEDLDAAYFDNLLGSSPPDPALPDENADITDTFLKHLFHPGRFSPSTLATALADYTGLKGQGSLHQRYAQLIGANVQMDISPQTGAPEVEKYRQHVKREWLTVWARARELDRQARWPVANAKWGDQAFIITREGLSMAVVQDAIGAIERFVHSGQSSGVSGYAQLPDQKARSDLIAIASAGSHLLDVLHGIADRPFEAMQEELQVTVRNGLQEPVEDFGQRLWADHVAPNVSEDDIDQLRRELSRCSDVEQAIADTLIRLSEYDIGTTHVTYSGVGNSLVTSTIQAVVAHRHRLAQATILLALFLLSEDEETSFELVYDALEIWHRNDILQWVAEQPADEAVQERQRKDDISSNLSNLRVHGAEDDGYDTSLSLLHHLLASGPRVTMRTPALAASTWLADINIDESFGHAILTSGLPLLAGAYANSLPASAAIVYIRGRAALAAGRVGDVVEAFQQASTGINDGSLGSILPDIITMFGFHQHIALLSAKAECHSATVHFGQNALRLNPDAEKPLWVAVFLAAKKLGLWDQAYSIVAAVPNGQWQEEFLDALVAEMCEQGQIAILNSFGFIDLAKKVEARLRFLADNSDPLKPPSYYKVLYSWYISRGDYCSAGDIMYRQAQRFKHVSHKELSLERSFSLQAQSYVACINALQLVDKKSAWIIVEGKPPSAPGVKEWKRRKVTGYIPEDQYASSKKPVFILDLTDIRAEYAMIMARLRLLDAGSAHNIAQTPAEVVAMAIQRGMYDLALSTASQGGVAMKEIFVSLATKCVELAESTPIHPEAISYLYRSPLTSRLRGSDAALSLRYLETVLKQYDSADTHYAYRTAVADVFFSLNSNKRNGWRMPAWLISWEMERNPEGWINMAVKWGWVEEALDWSAEMLRRLPPPELLPKDRADVAAVPYNLLDRVLAASKEGDEKEDQRVQAKAAALRDTIERRLAGLRKLEGR